MTKKNWVQPAGNFYDKYRTRNPIARALMRGFLDAFDGLVQEISPVGHAVEIGCGEGELSMRLARAGWRVHGYDIAADAVDEARQRASSAALEIPFEVMDIQHAGLKLGPAELVVCCEVLEHLDDPVAALRTLAGLSAPYLLVSVPREPVWRALNMARGRYVTEFGNTPGHVQHWTKAAFLSMLRSEVDVLAVRSPLPWTMALCRVRHV